MTESPILQRKFQTAFFVYVAMMGSLVVYLGLIELFSEQLAQIAPLDENAVFLNIRYLFYGLAVLTVVLIRWLRQLLLRKVPGSEEAAAGKRANTAILTAALCELPVLLGVVLFILGRYKPDFYFLLIVSLVLFFMYFPRIGHWRQWWQAAERKRI
jgi:hypothetical protein